MANPFNAFAQPERSALDYQNDYLGAQAKRQAIASNALAMQGQQATLQDAADTRQRGQAYREKFRTGDSSAPGFLSELSAIDPTMAGAYEKQRQDGILVASKSRLDAATAAEKEIDLPVKKANQAIMDIIQLDDPQGAHASLDAHYAKGDITKEKYDAVKATIPADPAGMGEWQKKMVFGIMDAKEKAKAMTPVLGTRNNGATTDNTAIDPWTGKVQVMATTTNTQDPNNKATVGASYANAAAQHDIAQSNRDAARIQTGFANEQSFRKEFEALPEIKNYKLAYPSFAAIKDAAGRDNKQSDINLVYGLAKLYDPTSVVREGEYATVANSQSVPENVKGWAQSLVGGARLTKTTRDLILKEADSRIRTYQTEAQKAKTSYSEIANRRGIDAANVFTGMGDMPGGTGAPAGKPTVSDW